MISQASASLKWFSGRFLSISMGLNFSCALISGSSSNYIAPILIVQTRSLESAFFFYIVMTSLTFAAVALYYFVDWKFDPILKLEEKQIELRAEGEQAADRYENTHSQNAEIERRDRRTTGTQVLAPVNTLDEEIPDIGPKDILHFGPVFWGCIFVCVFASNTFYMVTRIITNAGVHRYGYTFLQSKNFLPTIQVIAAIFTPINSAFITKFGWKLKVILAGTFSLFTAYVLMAVSPTTPSATFQLSVILVACYFFTYQSSIFPCLATSVPKEAVSIGLSVASFLQAIGLALLPELLGFMIEHQKRQEYQNTVYLMVGCAALSILLVCFAVKMDLKAGGVLDSPENSERAKKNKKELDRRIREKILASRGRVKEIGEGGRSSRLTGAATIKAGTSDGKSLAGNLTSSERGDLKEGGEDDLQ